MSIVKIDEAYHEYVSSREYADSMKYVRQGRDLIILRTFSKIYALAGLRVGYAISNEEIISHLNLVKSPFSVSNVGQRAALVSLENENFKTKSVALNLKNKNKLFDLLKGMGVNVIPSETNFLFFIPDTDTSTLNDLLIREGVIASPSII